MSRTPPFNVALSSYILKLFDAHISSSISPSSSSSSTHKPLFPRHAHFLSLSISPPRDIKLIKPTIPLHPYVIGNELSEVVLRMKATSLRYNHPRNSPLPPCRWCGKADAETGAHILTCDNMPPELYRYLIILLNRIGRDHLKCPILNPKDPANLRRLTQLSWGKYSISSLQSNPHLSWSGDDKLLLAAMRFYLHVFRAYREGIPPPPPLVRENTPSALSTTSPSLVSTI